MTSRDLLSVSFSHHMTEKLGCRKLSVVYKTEDSGSLRMRQQDFVLC